MASVPQAITTDEEKAKLYIHPGWETATVEGAELSTLKGFRSRLN